MKTYIVKAAFTTYAIVEVKAESIDKAKLLALNMDGEDFITDDDSVGYFRIVDCKLIKEPVN